MCGRFVQCSPFEILQQNFDISTIPRDLAPNYNVAPTQEIPAIVKYDRENKLEHLHWGLVPFWAKDVSIGSRLINARAETVSQKPGFRNAFKKRRCLIPANGFYEWKGEKGHKQPYYITTPSDKPFAFAGLWELWTDKDKGEGSVYKSCTIITTAASRSISSIHHRMPAILDPKFHEKWLNTQIQNPKELEAVLRDGLICDLRYYPVSKWVNAVKNNDPNCIKPMDES